MSGPADPLSLVGCSAAGKLDDRLNIDKASCPSGSLAPNVSLLGASVCGWTEGSWDDTSWVVVCGRGGLSKYLHIGEEGGDDPVLR